MSSAFLKTEDEEGRPSEGLRKDVEYRNLSEEQHRVAQGVEAARRVLRTKV